MPAWFHPLRATALVCALGWLAVAPVQASDAGEVGSAPLPGGVEGIRRAIGDRVVTPPAVLLSELTHRFYNATDDASREDASFARLLEWLQACQLTDACRKPPLHDDDVPLPGPPSFWIDHVLERRPAPEHLMLAILADRGAALLHTAFLSMDAPTRAWFIERPDLVRRLTVIDRGALAVAAPFLRIVDGRWRLPGGAEADRVWMDLASARLEDSPAFVLALLRAHHGLVVYALEVVATLDAPRQVRLLELDGEASASLAAGRALIDALKPSAAFWRPGERPFWRPSIDPSLLLVRLPLDASGRFAIPGGRRVWQLVYDVGDSLPADDRIRDAWDDAAPVSIAWLVEHIGDATLAERVIRAEQVLFASRLFATARASTPQDIVTTICGYARFPQLLRVLERMGVMAPARLAAMVRHAAALESAGDGPRARQALVQWQSVVTLVDYGVRSGSLTHEDAAVAIDALANPPVEAGGAHLRWLGQWLGAAPEGVDVAQRPLEQALVTRLTALPSSAVRRVKWEDEPYRLDFGAAERDRLARVRGRENRPLLDAAFAFLALSGAPAADGRSAADDLAAVTRGVAAASLDRPVAADDERGRRAREALAAARRQLTRDGSSRRSAAARQALAEASDALATNALAELAYAFSMGWAEDLPLTAAAAARRHILVRDVTPARRQALAWATPQIVTDRNQPWSVMGSLLGLDVGLSPVALRRVSMRPLTAAPLLNAADRGLLIATLAVADRRDFTDEAQRTLATSVAHARAQLQSDPSAGLAAASAAGVSPLRRTIAAWLATKDRAALASFFSLTELTRMGAGDAPLPAAFARWGNFDGPISGRLASGPLPELPAERYAGRSGRLLACATPDLQLALALGLAELNLPALLVPDLLPAALFDLVNTTSSRHTDDWQAIAERAQAVDRSAVERYLGLLTTLGPLRADAASPTH